jgi:serine/threonine protein kinase
VRELSLNNCRLDKRYDVGRQLGRGSYAEVYFANDILASSQSPHSKVVVKALNVFLQNDLDSELERTLVENFQNEAIALDRVRHPNIISRLGHGTARDLNGTVFHYLVLEYMAGGDMQKLLRQGNIPLTKALNYIEQVCSGLRHAHRQGVIHRDIKPQNLLLTEDQETVKIADFGVARFSNLDSPITRVGTNIYAPPEHSPLLADQVGVATAAKLTPAADIYSLAKSAYTIITSESPRYYANSQITDLPMGLRGEPWAATFLSVLNRATSNEPGERYQTVDEFWNELSKLKNASEEARVFAAAGTAPQAHVSRGYSPIAPTRPRFDTSRDLKLRFPAIVADERKTSAGLDQAETPSEISYFDDAESKDDFAKWLTPGIAPTGRRKARSVLRKAAAFFIFISLFAGLLYGTHAYLSAAGILSDVSNPFRQQTATANTDIFLRPFPNTNNDPIGLVTKNSKVRIVNSQNNWYQVDVVEQGRTRANQDSASRGWLNGKYLDMDGRSRDN